MGRHAKPPGHLIDIPHGGVRSWVNILYPAGQELTIPALFSPIVATWQLEPVVAQFQPTDYPNTTMIRDAVTYRVW